MDWIMLVIAFILGAISMFMMVCIGYAAKQEEPVNRVHFYVARDKNGQLLLYLKKPVRRLDIGVFIISTFGDLIAQAKNFSEYGLNPDYFKDLKWEDEPVEVFINMED
ncbi:MAG: hypothetical protein SPE73_10910 [Prevotella sp.]|nr:hypothetical protein [Prevotella sp.]